MNVRSQVSRPIFETPFAPFFPMAQNRKETESGLPFPSQKSDDQKNIIITVTSFEHPHCSSCVCGDAKVGRSVEASFHQSRLFSGNRTSRCLVLSTVKQTLSSKLAHIGFLFTDICISFVPSF